MPLDVYVDPSTGKIYWNDGSTESIAIDGNTANTLQIIGYSGQFSPGSTPGGANSLVIIKDNAGTDALTPGTTGYDLGSSTLRWKLFATTGDFNSTVTAPTFSGTATTARNIDIASAGNTDFIHYILFSRFETGTGLAVSSSIGLSYNPSSRTLIGGTFQGTFSGTLIGTFSGTATTSTNLHVNTGAANSSHRLLYSPQGNGIGIAVSSGAGLTYNPNTGMLTAGELTLLDNVNSTSITSGALIITGGVGIGSNVNIGGTATATLFSGNLSGSAVTASILTGTATTARNLVVNNSTLDTIHYLLFSPSATGSGVAVSSGLGLSYNPATGTLTVDKTSNTDPGLRVPGRTPSNNSSTGELIVGGGVGVGGSVSIGGRMQIFNNTNYASLRYDGTSNINYVLPSNVPSTGTSVLQVDTNGNLSWVLMSSASASPGGANGDIQYKDGSGFGATSYLNYSKTDNLLSIGSTSSAGSSSVREVVLQLYNSNISSGTNESTKYRFSPQLEFLSFGWDNSAGSPTTNSYRIFTDVSLTNPNVSSLHIKHTTITNSLGPASVGALGRMTADDASYVEVAVINSELGLGFGGSGSTQVNYLRTSPNQTSSRSYTFPSSYPAVSGYVLSSTTAGVLSWAAAGTGSPSGSNTQIQFNDGGGFGGAIGFTFNKITNLVSIGTSVQNTNITERETVLRILASDPASVSYKTMYSGGLEIVSRTFNTNALSSLFNQFKIDNEPVAESYESKLRFRFQQGVGISTTFSNSILELNTLNGVGIGATNSQYINYFKTSNSQTANKTYILPINYPTSGSTGSSVLSSDTSGNLNWVTMSGGSPGGSGTVNSGTGGSVAYYPSDGTAVSGSATITMIPGTGVSINSNINVTSGNELRISPTSNAAYTAIKSETTSTHTLTLPTAQNSSIGSSYLTVDTVGRMSYQPAVRKRSHRIQFGAALNPVAGADVAEFEIPYVGGGSGFTTITYRMLRAHARVGTASAIGSSFYIQKYAFNNGTGVSAFDVSPTSAAGSTFNILASPLIIQGDTTYESSTSSFAGAHITAVSGDKLRLFWLQASNTQYNFSISLYMEEDVS